MTQIELSCKEIETWMDVSFFSTYGNRWSAGFIHAAINEKGDYRGYRAYVKFRSGKGKWIGFNTLHKIWPNIILLIHHKQKLDPRINSVRIHIWPNKETAYDYLTETEMITPEDTVQMEGFDPGVLNPESRIFEICMKFVLESPPKAFRFSTFEFHRIGLAICGVLRLEDLFGRIHNLEFEVKPLLEILLNSYWKKSGAQDKHCLKINLTDEFEVEFNFINSYILKTLEEKGNLGQVFLDLPE